MWLGVDTGGTFTDFLLFDGDSLRVHKVLSTPDAPERAILQGIADLALDNEASLGALVVVHGSTVATNAVLEGKGVRTVYIGNHGLTDLLSIARQNRPELYNLQPEPITAPVPSELCLECEGRIAADGSELVELDSSSLKRLTEQLEKLKPEAVAINLLFSFLDDRHERAVEAIIPEGVFVSRSSKVLPEYREYERGLATWINAWVGPLMQRYLHRLKDGLKMAKVSVMQSSGGTIAIEKAAENAVRLLLSGPAGGLAAAKHIGELSGHQQLLTFDMGGTSTDVALIDGDIELTSEGRIGSYPIAVPMVDMHTIGAGGGSIAYVDQGGMLQVGPESAGAMPGPVCYGQGGTQITVTDANLILGRLQAERFLGGNMKLDVVAAEQAMDRLAQQLQVDRKQAAEGVIQVANEHMSRALRVVSVQRGIDPKMLTLVSFGGAGGLHVCALAETLGIPRAMVPIHSGVLSALGMLVAPKQRLMSRTVQLPLKNMDYVEMDGRFAEMTKQGEQELISEGVDPEQLQAIYSVDLRYQGQNFYLNIPWQASEEMEEVFHQLHQQRLGHRMGLPIELANLRVMVSCEVECPPIVAPKNEAESIALKACDGVYQRSELTVGALLHGPALIVDEVSTTHLDEKWCCQKDIFGNLQLTVVTQA